jgi:hypothetical protein
LPSVRSTTLEKENIGDWIPENFKIRALVLDKMDETVKYTTIDFIKEGYNRKYKEIYPVVRPTVQPCQQIIPKKPGMCNTETGSNLILDDFSAS